MFCYNFFSYCLENSSKHSSRGIYGISKISKDSFKTFPGIPQKITSIFVWNLRSDFCRHFYEIASKVPLYIHPDSYQEVFPTDWFAEFLQKFPMIFFLSGNRWVFSGLTSNILPGFRNSSRDIDIVSEIVWRIFPNNAFRKIWRISCWNLFQTILQGYVLKFLQVFF